MKSYLMLLLVLLYIAPVFAQDAIVINNDTTVPNTGTGVGDQFNGIVNSTRTGAGGFFSNGFSGDTALLLISGGLFILLFVVPLAMLNSIFWKRTDTQNTTTKIVRPTMNVGQRYDIGLSTGSCLKAESVDDVIDTLKYLEDVDVKIVNSTTSYKKIRIKGCRACNDKTSKKPICDFERGFLQGGFANLYKGVEVKETSCHAQGNAYCEFEVKMKR